MDTLLDILIGFFLLAGFAIGAIILLVLVQLTPAWVIGALVVAWFSWLFGNAFRISRGHRS